VRTKIKRGDTVEVISGRDKGTRGEVLKVLSTEAHVVIKGVNIRKKHQRQVQSAGRTVNPGIIQYEAPVDISHVMLVCPKCGEPTRVGIQREEGRSQRVCKNCQNIIDA